MTRRALDKAALAGPVAGEEEREGGGERGEREEREREREGEERERRERERERVCERDVCTQRTLEEEAKNKE